jgi:aminoglycoside N3'-acetyltransferase
MTNVATLRRETYRTGHMGAIGDMLRQTENRMRSAHAPISAIPTI